MNLPMCPRGTFHIISNTTGLSFELKRIGLLSEIILTHFYLLVISFTVKPTPHIILTFIIYIVFLACNCLLIPSAPRWVRHSYLSKRLQLIPYTCGSSRHFSGAVAAERSAIGKWNR